MRGMIAGSAVLIVFLSIPLSAFADTTLKEGRSVVVGKCSAEELVCAFMKDGSSVPTSECEAQQDGAIRIIPGDCYDED